MDIVLIHPEIPHNTGAIGRLCVGLNWPLHLIRPLGFSLDERHIKRAGMDYWEHLDLTIHDTLEDYLSLRKPTKLYFLSTKTTRELYKAEIDPHGALLFGAESCGLPKMYYEIYKDNLYTLPMPGPHARSINLANSVAIAAYEAYRQTVFATRQMND